MTPDIRLFTLDVETTMKGNKDSGLSHPMNPTNEIVMLGYNAGMGTGIIYKTEINKGCLTWIRPEDIDFVVGHNIGFDLKYIFRQMPHLKKPLQQCKLWDTQLAEYLLTAQENRWISLDELAKKYDMPLKDDKVTEYFKRGMGADEVPPSLLKEYLIGDVNTTRAIAFLQLAKATALDMLPLIISQMEALQATIEMTFNGLRIDTAYLTDYSISIEKELNTTNILLQSEITRSMGVFLGSELDHNSNKQLSTFLFGGIVKSTVKEAVGLYKNGKVKYKLMPKEKTIAPYLAMKPLPEWANKTGFSVDDEVINTAMAMETVPDKYAFLALILKQRSLNKSLNTYCNGLTKHILNYDFIYGNINHTATATGRLSSGSPNLQNISNDPIKKSFISRFLHGHIVEMDFSQLEVAGLAHVTGDKQLIYDMTHGVDMHSELYYQMYGKKPTKEERKPFKSRSFQLIYGAGAGAIAKQAGCSMEDAKAFINTFYTRYPGVAKYHEKILSQADEAGEYGRDSTGSIVDEFRHYYQYTETGRMFHYKEYENTNEWQIKKTGRKYSFSPTELKNYPIQGLATGDIVPLMLGILFRKLVTSKKYEGKMYMVNTIHDSIMFDVHDDVLDLLIADVRSILNDSHKYFESTFKVPLKLPLSVGCSVGSNWYQMIEIDFSTKIKEY